MRKLKVGLVGAGRGTGYGSQFRNHTRTEISAICDINPESLEKMRVTFGLKKSQAFENYDDFVKADIDIIFLGTPMPFHAEQAIKALENDKHVLSEVTMATTVKDCENIIRTVKKTGKKYMMAENYFYFHFIQEWKRIIEEEKLGRIFYAESEYVHEIRNLLRDPKTGKLLWRSSRPPIYYCSHCLGPLLMLLDDRVIKATASGKAISMVKEVGIGAIDMQVGIFETQKGATIKMLRSQVVPREPPLVYYSIYGTKGCVENGRWAHPYSSDITTGILYIEGEDKVARKVDWTYSDPKAPGEARKGGHGTSEYYLVKDFIDAIDNDTKPPIDAVRAADITIPGLIAHESAMKGNIWLDVPHFE
ncbi:Gfo/Idh/MocA family oxidoreductase [Candidatus Bathyarchaeota archaeon]|nr:Gfo/Idh/MocA family oxidoreductase [Candidatus Bathyarchaeota archaeon]